MSNQMQVTTPLQMAEMEEKQFNMNWREAEIMSQGVATIPKHLRGNVADCFAVVVQARSWGMASFPVAQKTHLVNGVLGYEAQLVNAVISSSKAIKGRFKYEYKGSWKKGDNASCIRTGAILNGETEVTWGEWLFPHLVTTKNSPLWITNPKQQAAYLAVKYWARLYTPDVILGVYSADELEDPIIEKDITPSKQNANDILNADFDEETGEVIIEPEPEPKIDVQAEIERFENKINKAEHLGELHIIEAEMKTKLSNLDDNQRAPLRVALRNKKSNLEFFEE